MVDYICTHGAGFRQQACTSLGGGLGLFGRGLGAKGGTLPFVPETADYLPVATRDRLLLVARGIVGGGWIDASLLLGADGVLMGPGY
ncbi:MAG: hypothetical protein GY761_05725 [Hyphomicrobiales bacterium]|nr:hypothetical protein [Hyphomicrobiales bacterium]